MGLGVRNAGGADYCWNDFQLDILKAQYHGIIALSGSDCSDYLRITIVH